MPLTVYSHLLYMDPCFKLRSIHFQGAEHDGARMAKWRTTKTAASGAPKSSGAIVDKREDEATEKGGSDALLSEEVVISVVVHCEGCARKLRRSLQRLEGVEEVIVDCPTNTVVVKGRQALENPMKVVENVEMRTGNKVVLLSPSPAKLPPPSKEEDSKKDAAEKSTKDDLAGLYMEMVVVLRIEMHCDACSEEIKRRILKIKGVEEAVLHLKSSQVMVKGAIEPATLVGFIHGCTGKKASIIRAEPVHPPSPEAMDVPLMEAEARVDTDAQKEDRSDSQEEKREGIEENKKEGNMGEEEDDVDDEKLKNKKASEGNRVEEETQVDRPNDPSIGVIQENHTKDHMFKLPVPAQVVAAAPESEEMAVGNSLYQYNYHPSYDYAYPPYAYQQYQYQQLHSYTGNPAVYAYPPYPPQTFNDENPEACSIM